MSLGDLFSLLLFALFIGVPLLSRFLRRGPPTGKTPPPTTRTGLPTTPPTQTTQRGDAAKSAAENAADDIGERLEQARRRVREAVEGQTARADTRTAQNPTLSPTGLESAGDMFRQEPVRSTPPVSTPVVVSILQRSGTARQPSSSLGVSRRATQPLQVERSLTEKRAKLSSNMLTFNREDIMRGIIWQQILDAPKSKRPWRTPSQHP